MLSCFCFIMLYYAILVSFCFVLFYFVLFCFVLFCFVLFGFILFYSAWLHGHFGCYYRSINEYNDCICHRHRAQAVPLNSFALYHTCQGTTILFVLCVLWVKLSQDKLYSLRGVYFYGIMVLSDDGPAWNICWTSQ